MRWWRNDSVGDVDRRMAAAVNNMTAVADARRVFSRVRIGMVESL